MRSIKVEFRGHGQEIIWSSVFVDTYKMDLRPRNLGSLCSSMRMPSVSPARPCQSSFLGDEIYQGS